MFWNASFLRSPGTEEFVEPEFVGAETVNLSSGGTITIDEIAGSVDTDVIVAALFLYRSSGALSVSSRPAGFSNVLSREDADGHNVFIDVKPRANVKPGSYSWTVSPTASVRRAVMLAYRGPAGVNAASPAIPDPVFSATDVLDSIDATAPGGLLALFFALQSAATISAGPAGMTARTSQPPAIGAYDLLPSLSGATGSKSATWSLSTTVLGALLQLS